MTRLVVTGTDTGIGKTVFSSGLAGFLKARYWKPVQSGLEEETDSEAAARLGALPAADVLPEAYRLKTPASPHLAAAIDGVTIDPARLDPPADDPAKPLVIEGAGGLMVPLTDDLLFIDVFARWRLPVVLCARSGLGTLNHTLLSLEALRARAVPVLGVVLIGPPHGENARMIARLGAVRVLGTLVPLDPLTPASLAAAFAAGFRREDFLEGREGQTLS
ncbi:MULTISPECIES: dethiobiotin synthase [unclassified Xanthobacter]|uniref:dethiobiotin synthase n=1 Tax=unclassified Xanthobacter TaxID=2623496 RepID=UPI001F22637E|nr:MULTISPECIES: dethiobiotin synthase [unclassified Xanthobacter]